MNKIKVDSPIAVVKRAFYLAYEACGGSSGMGFLQARNEVSEEEVWQNIRNSGDYPGKPFVECDGKAYADYVFGRMLKLGLDWDDDYVLWHDRDLSIDYQAWCGKYATVELLLMAAITSLKENPLEENSG